MGEHITPKWCLFKNFKDVNRLPKTSDLQILNIMNAISRKILGLHLQQMYKLCTVQMWIFM